MTVPNVTIEDLMTRLESLTELVTSETILFRGQP